MRLVHGNQVSGLRQHGAKPRFHSGTENKGDIYFRLENGSSIINLQDLPSVVESFAETDKQRRKRQGSRRK